MRPPAAASGITRQCRCRAMSHPAAAKADELGGRMNGTMTPAPSSPGNDGDEPGTHWRLLRRPPGRVEGHCRASGPRHPDRPALGTQRGAPGSPTRTQAARDGLRLYRRTRRMAGEAGPRRQRRRRAVPPPAAAAGGPARGARRAGRWRSGHRRGGRLVVWTLRSGARQSERRHADPGGLRRLRRRQRPLRVAAVPGRRHRARARRVPRPGVRVGLGVARQDVRPTVAADVGGGQGRQRSRRGSRAARAASLAPGAAETHIALSLAARSRGDVERWRAEAQPGRRTGCPRGRGARAAGRLVQRLRVRLQSGPGPGAGRDLLPPGHGTQAEPESRRPATAPTISGGWGGTRSASTS